MSSSLKYSLSPKSSWVNSIYDDINMMIEENNSELINEDYDFGSFLKQ